MSQYDVIAFDLALALLLACSFLFVLGLAAAVVEGIPWRQLRRRWQEWRTKRPLQDGESIWSRLQALQHEHDSEHVIGGKPRW